MSDVARRVRSERQQWAAPGGRHDRIIGVSYWLLPVVIGVLAALLVSAPLTMAGDVSFVLDKNKVDVAHERLKIQAAEYRGQDGKGQPFAIDAGSAVQKSSAEPIVQLNKLAARIQLPDGPASIKADTGHYDMDSERVKIDGPVNVVGPTGYHLATNDATVDLKSRTLQSGGAVTGTVPQGRFSANRLHADLAERTVTLDGNARLHLMPRQTR